ncbi:MAG TPA: serine hydrolase, partial [Polyangiaceae bacterium]|nr:serine hydrolase [Polyangiaceae bacterium]
MRQRIAIELRPLSLFLGFLPLLGLLAACAGSPPPAAPRPAPSAAPTALSAAPALPSPAQSAQPAPLPVGDPAAEGIDPAQLAALVERAAATSSDALVILKNGKLVGEWYFGKPRTPIETMSVTKSIVGLAIGRLIDEGKIASLDVPVHALFPEWNQGRKREITLRHLLDHTSGLQDPTTEEIYASPDFVKLALAAELSEDPGLRFRYNNKAVNLLAGVVQIASGERLDRFLDRTLFQPIGIREHKWELDKAGNPHGMAGLSLHPVDLARIGQLMLGRGAWGGARVLSQDWVDASTRPGQPPNPTSSLLWWLLPEWTKRTIDNALLAQWRSAGADPVFLRKMTPLAGRAFSSDAEFEAALQAALKPDFALWLAYTDKHKLRARRFLGPII